MAGSARWPTAHVAIYAHPPIPGSRREIFRGEARWAGTRCTYYWHFRRKIRYFSYVTGDARAMHPKLNAEGPVCRGCRRIEVAFQNAERSYAGEF